MKFHFNNVLFITIALVLATRLFGLTHDTYWPKIDHRYWSIQEEGNNNDKILTRIALLRIPFVENQGQISEEGVRYYAKTFGGTVFITSDGELIFSLPKYEEENVVRGWVIKESFVDASVVHVEGVDEGKTRVNYFKGKDVSNWRTDVPTYNVVYLGEIYENIELELKAYSKNIEKLFYIKAGADPQNIRVKIDGAQNIVVNEKGELEVRTELGNVAFTKPVAYQEDEDNGEKQYIEVAYEIQNDVYGFKIGKYDETRELVIDPLLASTFVGSSGNDYGYAMTLDVDNNVYITGYTYSVDFPTTPGAYDTSYNGGQEVYVSKLNSDLTELVASTYLGGSERDGCRAVAVDGNGNVFLAGWTNSSDFPATPGAYDTSYNGGDGDAFVSKLDSSLTTLLVSTFLGGSSGNDPATCIRIDDNGNVYVSGKAWSSDFPTTPGAYDETHGGSWDIFVSKFDNDLTTLSASTFLGGTSIDEVQSMALDESANIYMTGFTSSANFPTTPNAYDTSYADTGAPFWNYDVYVSSLDSSLSTLVASTFLGMIPDEEAYGLALDASGNVYVTGWTASDSFPTTPGAYNEEFNGGLRDAFISKFDSDVTTLLASTFLGGSNQNDYSRSIAFNGNVYVTGYTHSSDFPTTPNAFDTSYNGGYSDAWVSKLDSNLTSLDASTYLGGSINPGVIEQTYSIATDGDGNVYVSGLTPSSDFPTVSGSYDETHNGGRDIFVSKFDSNLSSELSIEEETSQSIFSYLQISPNPFSDRVSIKWSNVHGVKNVELNIFDVTGRRIMSFPINQLTNQQINGISWDGVDKADKKLPSGVYFLKFQIDDYIETQKLLLLR